MDRTLTIPGIFDKNPNMCVIVVDKDGFITYANKTYLSVLGLPADKVVGRPVLSITPETQTIKVIRSGKAVTAYNWNINGYEMIASAVPIFKEQEIAGCFSYSISMNIWDHKSILERLLAENNMLKDEVLKSHISKYCFDDLIGEDEQFFKAKLLARQVAQQDNTKVLITGESGTGKEIFAHAIHQASLRANQPFVRVNCAAIPDALLEAELFGYETGAFTGAKKGGRLGKFELANHGTIFLDEIGEMPLAMQSKLLVVLQERVIERLGGNNSINLNVRVISATNRDLQSMMEKGLFREDLYYRLNVVQIEIPPLRRRKGDILLLFNFLLHRLNQRLHMNIKGVKDDAREVLLKYSWPGNVRELENVMERAMSLAHMEQADRLGKRHLTFICAKMKFDCIESKKGLKAITQEFEEGIINAALEETSQNKAQAAKYLDIDLSSLYRKMKKYGIPID
ncbi:MAG: sigma 54-interacting transcriptional regulator [Syntrophomonadaceae bacterium]|nr:sigma 54-interacting transcriptional regulator [Syntrophomonadaceae bacterium]